MNYYLAGFVTWGFMFQWCSRYRINCRSLGISQCKTLNDLDELSMDSMSSRWTLNEQCPYQLSLFTGRLSMQNSQWTLNGQCPYKSLNGQLSRDKGLYCLTMEIVYWTTFNVSTLNGQWTSFNRLNSQWTIGHPLSGKEGWQKNPMKMWSFTKSAFTTHP